jgi:hypothetical protein
MPITKVFRDVALVVLGFTAGVAFVRFRGHGSGNNDVQAVRQESTHSKVLTPPMEVLSAPGFMTEQPGALVSERLPEPVLAEAGPAIMPPPAESWQDARLRAKTAIVERKFGEFLASYRAQGKDAEMLRRMLIEREMAGGEVVDIATSQGINMADPRARASVIEMATAATRDYVKYMKDVMGDADFKALTQHEGRQPERTIADYINTKLAGTGMELSPEQRKQFVEVLFNTKEPNGGRLSTNLIAGEGPAASAGMPVRVVPEAALRTLGGVLTPSQMAVLTELFRAQHSRVLPVDTAAPVRKRVHSG